MEPTSADVIGCTACSTESSHCTVLHSNCHLRKKTYKKVFILLLGPNGKYWEVLYHVREARVAPKCPGCLKPFGATEGGHKCMQRERKERYFCTVHVEKSSLARHTDTGSFTKEIPF